MSTILGTNKTSKCLYCGSSAYGVGCVYSPHHKHVHADDPKRCIYCGSTSYGVGCSYNPFGKTHIHGVEYNVMIKESVHKCLTAGIFLNRLMEPITETSAFKLGLIDSTGKKIKQPVSIEEQNALTPIDQYIFKLRRLVTEDKLALLSALITIETINDQDKVNEKFDPVKYKVEVSLKHKMEHLVESFRNILAEGCESGLTKSAVENMFFEQLSDKTDRTDGE